MKSSNKMKAAIGLMLVVGVLALGIAVWGGSHDLAGGVVLWLVLALLAVFLIGSVLARKRKKKHLAGSYLSAYDAIVQRIGTSSLSIIDKREAVRQTMEVLVEASHEGKTVGEAIGEPVRFADSLIAAYGGVRSVLSMMLRGVQFMLLYALFLQLVTLLIDGQAGAAAFFETRTLLMTHVAYGVIVLTALPLFNAGSGRKHAGVYFGLAALIVFGVTAAFMLGGGSSLLAPLYKEVVVFGNAWHVILWALGLAVLQLAYRKAGRRI